MRNKRIKSFLLAVVMVVTALPLNLLEVFAAATPQLSFTTGDPNAASIITGQSITLKKVTPSGYVNTNLIVTRKGSTTPISSGITIPFTGNDVDTVTVDEKFDPNKGTVLDQVNPILVAEGTYAIQGEYYALSAEGRVVETNQGDSRIGTIKCTTEKAIMEASSCTLECTEAETESGWPALKITEGKGLFANYVGQLAVIENITKDPSKTKELTFVLKQKDTGKEMNFTMYPKLTYSYVTKDMNTKQDTGEPVLVDGKPQTKPADNFVRKGTKFELSFTMPESNQLLLTVLTPQAAMNRIEDEIRQSDGRTNTSFIRLGTDDDLNYITEDFDLRGINNQFNARFTVAWEWAPDETQVVDGKEVQLQSMNEATKKRYEEAVVPGGGNAEWQRAVIDPLEDDVKGTLTATVSYTKPGGNLQKTASTTLPVKNILVRGTGKPVNVTQIRQITGIETGTEPKEFGADSKLPGAKTMDAYQGDVPGYKVKAKGPYQYELQLDMGAKNGAAKYAVVEVSGDSSAISLKTQQGSEQPLDYKPGGQIANPQFNIGDNMNPGRVNLTILAQRLPVDSSKKTATLTIKFFIPDRNQKLVESSTRFQIRLGVEDSTPSQDSTLEKLIIRDQKGDMIDYPFSPTVYRYQGIDGTIHLPYKTESITLTPILNDARGGEKDITVTRKDVNGVQIGDVITTRHEIKTNPIAFEVGKLSTLEVKVPAQDPREEYWSTYYLDIVRDRPSEDNTLKSLGIYFEDDTKMSKNLVANFNPSTLEYNIEIPYSTKRLRVRAEKNDSQAQGPTITPELTSETLFGEKQWLDNLSDKYKNDPDHDGILDLTFEVQSEAGVVDGGGLRTYTVHIRRLDPNDDATLKSMEVTDADDKKLTYKPNFKADTDTYTLEIPYSTAKIKLKLMPSDTNINNIQIYSQTRDKLLFDMAQGQIKLGALTSAMEVLPISDSAIQKIGYHSFFIVVTAENEKTTREYELRVQREAPSDVATLKSLVLKDQDGVQIKTLAFHPDETSYSLQVPYETNGISFTPTSSHPGAVIRLKDGSAMDLIPGQNMLASGITSKVYKLADPGEPKEFQVVVTAEDGKTEKIYYITVTRGAPSSDSRLKGLKVDNVDEFTPLFIASKTKYEAVVTEGAPGVIITATANHPGATIRINGNVVPSGQPSDLIELIEIKSKIQIEVIAQDGQSRTFYTIEFTNTNLIEKTSNADLKRLTVNYGLMTPNFKPAVTEYEVAVTENTYSVDIIPRSADSLATVQVFSGSKELGDYNGNYAQALEDGENDITIKVTSPDKTVTKDYTLSIYRNEEDELKNLTPLEADDIDFENSDDVIVVMIDEYPRVSADVFNALKEYPEKSIVFQGNDYSLWFKASDLKRVIPQTEIYDFRMSFTSPDEDDIYDLIDSRSRNDDIINKAVMLYFYYHGSLPGPATFNLSLGRKYANDTLYWHYYNQERDRIDYYGSLKSNKKGTIAVAVDHFSTYILTPNHRIVGSEDKAGVIDELGQISDGTDNINAADKVHPYTGTQGGRP